MVRTIATKVHKTDPLYERIALIYYNRGNSPEEVIEALKSADYQVTTSTGLVSIDAVTVANIVRGLRLASTIKPITKPRAKRSTKQGE